jgi:hypothetical protein
MYSETESCQSMVYEKARERMNIYSEKEKNNVDRKATKSKKKEFSRLWSDDIYRQKCSSYHHLLSSRNERMDDDDDDDDDNDDDNDNNVEYRDVNQSLLERLPYSVSVWTCS